MATIEEPILSDELAVKPTAAADTAEETAKDKNPPEKFATVKKVSALKEAKKKVPAPRNRSSSSHPPYFEMIKDAIVTLKERTGSSQYAITKFIEDKEKNLPANFRKVLLVQLRKLVANEKLAKVKNSFKVPSARSPKPVQAVAAPAKKKPTTTAKLKPKAAAAKDKVSAAKAKLKPKSVAAKPKAAAPAKAKAAPKRKAAESTKTLPAKATRTSTRTNPGRKTAPIDAIKKATPVKKAPSKSVKSKTVKSPAKKAPSKSVKSKTVKSPAKKAAVGKKGKK